MQNLPAFPVETRMNAVPAESEQLLVLLRYAGTPPP